MTSWLITGLGFAQQLSCFEHLDDGFLRVSSCMYVNNFCKYQINFDEHQQHVCIVENQIDIKRRSNLFASLKRHKEHISEFLPKPLITQKKQWSAVYTAKNQKHFRTIKTIQMSKQRPHNFELRSFSELSSLMMQRFSFPFHHWSPLIIIYNSKFMILAI